MRGDDVHGVFETLLPDKVLLKLGRAPRSSAWSSHGVASVATRAFASSASTPTKRSSSAGANSSPVASQSVLRATHVHVSEILFALCGARLLLRQQAEHSLHRLVRRASQTECVLASFFNA